VKSAFSAGLIMYRKREGRLEVLLVHPGGPFWAKKDPGAWTIPKGEVKDGEELLTAARREFREELGLEPGENLQPLQPVRQKGGKVVHAWCFEGDADPAQCHSNVFQIEWPPRSGRMQQFPEVDRAQFFPLPEARLKINPAQVAFLDELAGLIA
jgi:predicted NUDIX family NTP pyrophosphohydrolase